MPQIGKKDLEDLILKAKKQKLKGVNKYAVSRFGGFDKQYLNQHFKLALYYTLICLIAEKKGIDLLDVIGMKDTNQPWPTIYVR